MANPLLNDRDVEFTLYDVLDGDELSDLDYFSDHSRETFDAIVDAARRVAREVLFPGYETLDKNPPTFVDGQVHVTPELGPMLKRLADMGLVNAARPYDVGGQQVPLTIMSAASAYLMAGNLSAYGYVGLSSGAAHLIEAFGDDEVRGLFLDEMYRGEWTGTMALTEPQAGSSLGDLTTSATPTDDGTYRIRGSKIFISGGDHDLADNIVHLVLARIDGGPVGTKGISLFAVPKNRRGDDGSLVPNDVAVTGVIRKIGWKSLPSLALGFGEHDDCVGWLVGEPNRGLAQMFQMMNEARLMVGLNATATASVAYQESLSYARERTQGRIPGAPSAEQVPLITHADVRRMLLRQKAIVDGSFTLLLFAAKQSDLSEHAATEEERQAASALLNLLTPVAKTFPAEYGYESNTLAVQIHGGYGYTSEYLPEAWLRDQKLNSIHEGTTGIQSIDLLGRRALAGKGAAMMSFVRAVSDAVVAADAVGVDPVHGKELMAAVEELAGLTAELGAIGAAGDGERMLRHSADYLQAFSIVVIAWQHLTRSSAATRLLAAGSGDPAHLQGVLQTTDYWFATELPTGAVLLSRIRSGEDSYAAMDFASF